MQVFLDDVVLNNVFKLKKIVFAVSKLYMLKITNNFLAGFTLLKQRLRRDKLIW